MESINTKLIELTRKTINEPLTDDQCIEIMNNLIDLEMYLRELKHKYSEYFTQAA
ncbi:MAG: hypothetical protein IKN42_07100 [Elusimicrobia bacterium]|nr:hypothetical protein [Elusimicrobiota bacterium]